MVQATPTAAIGINLGATFSVTAYLDKYNGEPKIIESDNGSNNTPSYVAWTIPKNRN